MSQVGKGTKNRYSGYTGGASDWTSPPETVDSLRQWLRERILPAMQGAYDGADAALTVHEFLRDAIVELERRITVEPGQT